MDEKWNVQRKGYLKIHVAVNIKTKEILALEVTNETVHDGKILTKMVNHVLDKPDTKIESVPCQMELMIQTVILGILR